jgi:hypothetical protein
MTKTPEHHAHSEPHHAHAPEPKLEAPEKPTQTTATSIPQATQDSVNVILQDIVNDYVLHGQAGSTWHGKVLVHQANVKNTLKNANF